MKAKNKRWSAILEKWDHEVVTCVDGAQAWEILQDPKAPPMAILDWMMPYIDGVELCERVRQLPHGELVYIILLTAKNEKSDIIQGLSAGVDDYVVIHLYKCETKKCSQTRTVLRDTSLFFSFLDTLSFSLTRNRTQKMNGQTLRFCVIL